MLNNKGFDLWADSYDKTVGISDEENTKLTCDKLSVFKGLRDI